MALPWRSVFKTIIRGISSPRVRSFAVRQLVCLVMVLGLANWATGNASWSQPWRFLYCSNLQGRMEALYYLGVYVITHVFSLPDNKEYDRYILAAAHKNQLDMHLIKALIETESNFRFYAISPKGACGLMQLLPVTARSLGVKDLFDPEENIMAGTQYLRQLTDRFQGDLWLAVISYNWGPTRMSRIGRNFTPDMEKYILKVLRARFRYSSLSQKARLTPGKQIEPDSP